ncbi:thiosulfate oxidation carrier complex protein SoxZ [Methylomonas sp. EFPC3]|uniref:thiosulfate oxidation carrier complex protein SoxZ n=1 Tax=Methylomonas sp. EFPC3 TaxID=3021710 RepID=UPI0024163BBF|nr:thiosulfate oxidation carrier complex protein SoxZ [Methylomonas sp. EFPC3]WFP51018.1 thiosulfate oxidation carrier complex protein SoxZ [Methylomonas sp. EFPC3]
MNSIKVRSRREGELIEVKVLIEHPMENGRNRDAAGNLIPAHFIEQLALTLNAQPLLTVNMAGSVSKNPFFSFRLKQAADGDVLRVDWRDNLGSSDSAEHRIGVNR